MTIRKITWLDPYRLVDGEDDMERARRILGEDYTRREHSRLRQKAAPASRPLLASARLALRRCPEGDIRATARLARRVARQADGILAAEAAERILVRAITDGIASVS